MRSIKDWDLVGFWTIVLGIILILTIAIAQPYFEAKSFNKLTGGSATYWDAVFSELRVDGSSQK